MLVEQNIRLGIIYGLTSAFLFALMSQLVKIIGPDVPVSMLIFFRFLVSLIGILPFLIRDKDFKFKLIPPYPGMYLIRILCPLIALGIIFFSINRFEIVNVLLLQNSAPLFVPILVWLISGVNTPHKVKIGIILGFIGVAVILKPSTDIFYDLYSMLPLFAGLMIAFAILYIRLIGKVNTPNQMFFYLFYISTIISGVFAIYQWKTSISMEQWLLIFAMSISGFLYQLLASYSYLKAPVRLMSPLVFMQTVFGGILDWIIWNNIPGLSTIIGTVLVITGGVITVYFGMHLVKES